MIALKSNIKAEVYDTASTEKNIKDFKKDNKNR